MPYSTALADRIQALLGDMPGLAVKKMFGGVGFILHGNMACGVNNQSLIVRIPPDETAAALAQPHTRVFDLTGKAMKGWVLIDPPGYDRDEDLSAWIQRGVAYAASLPAK